MRLENITPVLREEMVLGTVLTLLIIEALRRAVTPVLAGLVAVLLAYLMLTEHAPGVLRFRDISGEEIVELMYLYNGQGIYGPVTGVAATLVAVFITFGAFVAGSGVGRLFANLGTKLAGHQIGGPAKIAVITSAMFGTVSGSSTSNVYTTGSFTIPMMKRVGYRPSFAGGVEVAASVGGQLMPPIMGTGAFIMAELTNIPYVDIVGAALLGALAYFAMVLICVHLEARRKNLRGVDRAELPSWSAVLKDIHLLLPLIVLIAMLVLRYSPHAAALASIATVIIVSTITPHTRLGPRALFDILATAGRNVASVAIACVGASMVIAAVTKTGLVLQIGGIISSASGGQLWIAGGMLSLTCLVLGMGMPTSAAYIITAAIGAPVLISEFGVPILAAHLFVFYFAILAEATPPVSIASYAAAAIAKAPPMITGIEALRLAACGFVIGYSYLFSQTIMMEGAALDIVLHIVLILLCVVCLSAGLLGFLNGPIWLPWRPVLVVVALTVIAIDERYDPVLIPVMAGLLALGYFAPGLLASRRIAVKQVVP
jgi:TRAP transporter 4TM/12TM fusion protein